MCSENTFTTFVIWGIAGVFFVGISAAVGCYIGSKLGNTCVGAIIGAVIGCIVLVLLKLLKFFDADGYDDSTLSDNINNNNNIDDNIEYAIVDNGCCKIQ